MSSNQKGFTLIELVMVIVILGILAAVAIPKFASLATDAEIAAEEGVVGGIRSGLYVWSADQIVQTGSRSFPDNPYDALDVTPNTYDSTIGDDPTANDQWTYDSTQDEIEHQRKDGTKLSWDYSSSSGLIGDRVTETNW